MMYPAVLIRALCAALLMTIVMEAHAADTKHTVGATEAVTIREADIRFEARIDTGAESCAIHATDIRFEPSLHGHPRISFLISNRAGEQRRLQTDLDSVVSVRSSEGMSLRYKVPLTVQWKQHAKTVLFTLKDRSRMQYRILLGRNWLKGDFIVDVDQQGEAP